LELSEADMAGRRVQEMEPSKDLYRDCSFLVEKDGEWHCDQAGGGYQRYARVLRALGG